MEVWKKRSGGMRRKGGEKRRNKYMRKETRRLERKQNIVWKSGWLKEL